MNAEAISVAPESNSSRPALITFFAFSTICVLSGTE